MIIAVIDCRGFKKKRVANLSREKCHAYAGDEAVWTGMAVHVAYWPPFFLPPDRIKLKKNLTAKTDVTLTLFPIRFHYLPFYCIFLPFCFTAHTINIFIFYG